MALREDIEGLRWTVDPIGPPNVGVERPATAMRTQWRGAVKGRLRKTGRGERASASLNQQSLRFVMINRTPRGSLRRRAARSA